MTNGADELDRSLSTVRLAGFLATIIVLTGVAFVVFRNKQSNDAPVAQDTNSTTAAPAATTPATAPLLPVDASQFLTANEALPPEQVVGAAEGAFRIVCRGGHLNYDDPIVHPGQPNAMHLHQFFGNLSIDAATTSDNISENRAGSTCQGGALNDSAYWVPALVDGASEQVVPIESVTVYYKGEPHHTAGPVQALPPGLRMVVDDGNWACGETEPGPTIPACGGDQVLYNSINFNWCWNGELDSADHRSHLAPASRENDAGEERCPATHPTVIPRVSYNISYGNSTFASSDEFYLASDVDPMMNGGRDPDQVAPGSTSHADYMEGWRELDPDSGLTFSQVWHQNCLEGFKNCDFGDLGDGRRMLAFPEESVIQQPSPVGSPMPS
jgi:Domain of unknown function (DUF1996)